MSIVSGVAIDKNEQDGKLQLTAELVDTQTGSNNTQQDFRMISMTVETMFEIVRNMISMTGTKLFWSHMKVIIFSEEIAREGLVKVVDWYSRDTETRSDVYICISGRETAISLDLESLCIKIDLGTERRLKRYGLINLLN